MSNTTPIRSNVPEFSVSELAFSLKRTLEENYARVRVRGELSRVSIPASGHMYSSLKDDQAVVDAVCWKGVLSKLSIRPEEGLEVICTGRITTYPARSNYQLIIETMELAGEGALLKMLEERKKKLAAEGLFTPERKKEIPFLPGRIGVITSPTGAVIRDILHRLRDRFPRHVLVWPVKVQGEGADKEIATAVAGFNALPKDKRPDILIVARGGGSLEDLMAFNEESVVRAVAGSNIPVISAVGHETDTTLVDYAADLRAPTPTGAAEMAVPMRINLMAQVAEDEKRLLNGLIRFLSEYRHKLEAASAKLGDPTRFLDIKAQRLDHLSDNINTAFDHALRAKEKRLERAASKLVDPSHLVSIKKQKLENTADKMSGAFRTFINRQEKALTKVESQLRPPHALMRERGSTLKRWDERLDTIFGGYVQQKHTALDKFSDMLTLLSFENVLQRGFVVVQDKKGRCVTDADSLRAGQNVRLRFKDNKSADALIQETMETRTRMKPNAAKPHSSPPPKDQGRLF